MAKQKQWSEMTAIEKRNGIIGVVVVGLIVFSIIGALQGGTKTPPTDTAAADTTSNQPKSAPTPAAPPVRKVTGTAATLGAGTFAGGKDVAAGLYDVTAGPGESGNFYVHGVDSANEILGDSSGMGVPKVRVQISSGDTIEISDLSQVIFTPVTAPFVTDHALTNLYAGTFTVGEDIGAGRYVATTTAGSSGNFIVHGADSANEILGDKSSYGVPSVTVNLAEGDEIEISGLSQVTLTPVN